MKIFILVFFSLFYLTNLFAQKMDLPVFSTVTITDTLYYEYNHSITFPGNEIIPSGFIRTTESEPQEEDYKKGFYLIYGQGRTRTQKIIKNKKVYLIGEDFLEGHYYEYPTRNIENILKMRECTIKPDLCLNSSIFYYSKNKCWLYSKYFASFKAIYVGEHEVLIPIHNLLIDRTKSEEEYFGRWIKIPVYIIIDVRYFIPL